MAGLEKSLFVKLSANTGDMAAKYHRLHRNLADFGLNTKGIYGDKNKAVSSLAWKIRKHAPEESFRSRIHTVAQVFSPQNIPDALQPPIDFGFGLDLKEARPPLNEESAGAIACSQNFDFNKGPPLRLVDLEGLTLLASSVFRRLGIPAFYCYVHTTKAKPVLRHLSPELNRQILEFPYSIPAVLPLHPTEETMPIILCQPFRDMGNALAIELLEDNYISAILSLKAKIRSLQSIMDSFAKGHLQFDAGMKGTAESFGHELFAGSKALKATDASSDRLLDPEGRFLAGPSAREAAYLQYFQMFCDHRFHVFYAATQIVNDEAHMRDALALLGKHAPGKKITEFREKAASGEYGSALKGYIGFLDAMVAHAHDGKNCPSKKILS